MLIQVFTFLLFSIVSKAFFDFRRSQNALAHAASVLRFFTLPETLSRRSLPSRKRSQDALQRLTTPQSDFLKDFQKTSTPHNASQRVTTPHKCVPPARPRTITFFGFTVFESSVTICFLCFNTLRHSCILKRASRSFANTGFHFFIVFHCF